MEVSHRNKGAPDVSFVNAQDEEYEHALPASAFPEKCVTRTWKQLILDLDWWLIIYLILWYAQSALYVTFNKMFLNKVALPWSLSAFQLLIGWGFMLFFWGCNVRDKPHFDNLGKFCKIFLPMGALHYLVHVGSVVSMGLGAVSFTHVVKALEPIITAVLSTIVLHQFSNIYVYLSMIPVVVGVSLASLKELDFNIWAFGFAMLSNISGAFRSIFAKMMMTNKEELGENLTPNNIYLILTLIASLVSLFFVLTIEATHCIPIWRKATAHMTSGEISWLLFYGFASGFFYFLSNDSAFYCLGKINQVTYSVANTAKRVLIIGTSIIVFKNRVSALGYIGMVLAIFGTFLYSIVK